MYKSLQAGRAIAAILVLLFHLAKAIDHEKYFGTDIFTAPLLFGGRAGVDFFFVLSGFIIYFVHQADLSRPDRLPNYLYKRVTRIYPTYWIIFLAVYLTVRLTPSLSSQVPHDLWVVLKALSLAPLDPAVVGGTGAPVLIVAWSLQYEMLFYGLFALAVFDHRLGLAAAGLILAGYVYAQFLPEVHYPLALIATDNILLFFMGMVAAAYCSSRDQSLLSSGVVFALGLAAFSIAALEFNMGTNIIAFNHTIAFGLASMLMVIGLVGMEDNGTTLLGSRLFQLLGGASYALYLLHYPMISVLCKVALALGLQDWGLGGAWFAFIAIAAICMLVSVIFYLVIETPIARLISRHSPRATD